MNRTQTKLLEKLAGPTYLVAALLVGIPIMDLILNAWPFAPGSVDWRYGTVGLMSGFLLTPIIGVVLALGAAALLGHRSASLVLGALCLVGAVLLLILTASFGLDSVQLRGTVTPEARRTFDLGVLKAVVKNLAGTAALAWLGAVGWKMSRYYGGDSEVTTSRIFSDSKKG